MIRGCVGDVAVQYKTQWKGSFCFALLGSKKLILIYHSNLGSTHFTAGLQLLIIADRVTAIIVKRVLALLNANSIIQKEKRLLSAEYDYLP